MLPEVCLTKSVEKTCFLLKNVQRRRKGGPAADSLSCEEIVLTSNVVKVGCVLKEFLHSIVLRQRITASTLSSIAPRGWTKGTVSPFYEQLTSLPTSGWIPPKLTSRWALTIGCILEVSLTLFLKWIRSLHVQALNNRSLACNITMVLAA